MMSTERQQALEKRYSSWKTDDVLRALIEVEFPDKICVVSSFGAESSVLLHKVAQINPHIPIVFLNTGKLFGETLRYRDKLQHVLGLTDIRSIAPLNEDLVTYDGQGDLWQRDADKCCHIRKVLPQERALKSFDAVITGRKKFQTQARQNMRLIESDSGRIRINPLINYDLDSLEAYLDAHDLPRHVLVKDGYKSIGCMPCTARVTGDGDYRSGRWQGQDKQECGIHKPKMVYGDGI